MILNKKVALITGAGQGVGQGIALAMVNEGAPYRSHRPHPGKTRGNLRTDSGARRRGDRCGV